MDATASRTLWGQFGAAIDTLERAIQACPDELWHDYGQPPEFWYVAYHALFFLDLYLDDSTKGFAPPAPFSLSELEPTGVMPDRVYRKDELLAYLAHGRSKAHDRIAALTPETAHAPCDYGWLQSTRLESLLYNMRHVQHHAAQLNLLLRQATHSAPGWIARTGSRL